MCHLLNIKDKVFSMHFGGIQGWAGNEIIS